MEAKTAPVATAKKTTLWARLFPKKNDNAVGTFKDHLFAFFLILPYLLAFTTFIVIPVGVAIGLSFTDFNSMTSPNFVGLTNYINLFTNDDVFMQKIVPNTIKFALICGPIGYFLSFLLAWMLAQIPKAPRTLLALLIYSPSLTSGVTIQVVWIAFFSGDANGYLNSLLLQMGVIHEAVQWLQSETYLMPIMIFVTIWSSMGVGFLAMLSGILNIDSELYEAAYVDGLKNRFQEIRYITIPSMKPQLLFGAVMSIVSTFQAGSIGVQLSGSNPTPNYAGSLIMNHIEDYGYIRYEMGYASAISVVLLILIYVISKIVRALLADNGD
jgi:multiple sugar transport system permease protein